MLAAGVDVDATGGGGGGGEETTSSPSFPTTVVILHVGLTQEEGLHAVFPTCRTPTSCIINRQEKHARQEPVRLPADLKFPIRQVWEVPHT